MGTTDELLYERKHILGSADSKQFSFTVGDDRYTILTSESVGGRNESQMRIGMKNDLIQLKRNEGEAVWRTPGRYGREFRTLEEIIKYIRK